MLFSFDFFLLQELIRSFIWSILINCLQVNIERCLQNWWNVCMIMMQKDPLTLNRNHASWCFACALSIERLIAFAKITQCAKQDKSSHHCHASHHFHSHHFCVDLITIFWKLDNWCTHDMPNRSFFVSIKQSNQIKLHNGRQACIVWWHCCCNIVKQQTMACHGATTSTTTIC